jgi:hypothetical protein
MNSWKYFDRMINYLMINFVEDVVRDGEEGYELFYERIKDFRGTLKRAMCQGEYLDKSLAKAIFFYEDIISLLNQKNRQGGNIETRRDVQNIAILCQKRATGMPTPSMRMKAYKKYFQTCSVKDLPLTEAMYALVKDGCQQMWSTLKVREDFFKIVARCQRNEKVSLSSSADLLNTKEEGGKLKSANLILHCAFPQPLFNLETGERTGDYVTRESVTSGAETIGTVLLHHAVQAWKGEVPNCRLSSLLTVKPVAVGDQGKYRIATASHPLHSFLLQPLAQLAKSALLQFESTRAGMEKQYHAWEFYKRIKPGMVQPVKLEGQLTDRENFFYCSDWSMASDNLHRESVRILLEEMVEALGVPKFYGRLCIIALTSPRINWLNPSEKVPPDVCPPQFISRRGILQGDPITKNVMQLMHIACRFSARRVLQQLAERSKMYVPLSIKLGETHRPSSHWPTVAGPPDRAEWKFAKTASNTGAVTFLFGLLKKQIDPDKDPKGFKELVKRFLETQLSQQAQNSLRPPPGIKRLGLDLSELRLLAPITE